MDNGAGRTATSIIAQLAREACAYHAEHLMTPKPSTDPQYIGIWDDLILLDEPYISDSTVDELTASLDAITILTFALTDEDLTVDGGPEKLWAAMSMHTPLPDTFPLHDSYDCACDIIDFVTPLVDRHCPKDV